MGRVSIILISLQDKHIQFVQKRSSWLISWEKLEHPMFVRLWRSFVIRMFKCCLHEGTFLLLHALRPKCPCRICAHAVVCCVRSCGFNACTSVLLLYFRPNSLCLLWPIEEKLKWSVSSLRGDKYNRASLESPWENSVFCRMLNLTKGKTRSTGPEDVQLFQNHSWRLPSVWSICFQSHVAHAYRRTAMVQGRVVHTCCPACCCVWLQSSCSQLSAMVLGACSCSFTEGLSLWDGDQGYTRMNLLIPLRLLKDVPTCSQWALAIQSICGVSLCQIMQKGCFVSKICFVREQKCNFTASYPRSLPSLERQGDEVYLCWYL